MLATVGLVAVLVVTGLVLMWAYRPAPAGPEVVRTVHRLASALLLPASWVLVVAMAQARWGRGRAPVARWGVPVLMLLAVPAAAFTGFLLPWQDVFHATAVVPPDLRGMGVAFDAGVATVSFGGAPVPRATYQRYVLAHLFLGTLVAVVFTIVATTSRRSQGPSSPSGTTATPSGRR